MSLVNDMLNDIQKRKTPDGPTGDSHEPGQQPPQIPPAKKGRLKWLLIIAVILIIIFVGAQWWRKTSENNAKHLNKISSQDQSIKNLRNTISKLSANSQLSSVQLDYENDHAVMQLSFDKLPHYHFESDKKKNSLNLLFDKTTNNSNLSIEPNPFIRSVKAQDNDGGLTLSLLLGNQVRLISAKNNKNNLALNFVREPDVVEVIEEKAKPQESEEEVVTLTPGQIQAQNYQEAITLLQERRQADAINILKLLTQQDPSFHKSRITLTKVYLQQNQTQLALDILKQGLFLSPNYEPYVTLYARALLIQDKPEQALASLKSISPDINDSPDYYALMAVLEQRVGNYLYAAELYHELLSTYDARGTWWVGLGISLQAGNQTNAAIDAYKNALNSKDLKPDLVAFVKVQIMTLGG